MRCARLRLQERPCTKPDLQREKEVKARRYCQRRMVDPGHEEDPRWMDVFDRYHCKKSFDQGDTTDIGSIVNTDHHDICLTVQNLKFLGEEQDVKRPRTSFKYRLLTDNKRHRMFTKQVVENIEPADDFSQLTSYYFDDYVKYILNNDRSRPSSSKSSVFFKTFNEIGKENKAVQVENKPKKEIKKTNIPEKVTVKPNEDVAKKNESNIKEDNIDDAKVLFTKSGKRKSLTISRVPSPETVQVIRVDVVCNYSTSSSLSEYEDKKLNDVDAKLDKIEDLNLKGPHFSNKYLLTNTVKSLDENVPGGAKVTLLCKTFKLSDRLKLLSDRKKAKAKKDGKKLRK